MVEEANVEELVESNQLLTNENNLLEPLTVSPDEAELIELRKESILPRRFRFIDLSLLSDVFSLLACPNCSTTKTFKTLKVRKKDLQDLCKLNV